MRWLRRFGALAGVLAVMWLPIPANAAINITFECPSPSDEPVAPPDVNDCTPETDQVISGIWKVTVQATSNQPFNGVRKLDLWLIPNPAEHPDCPGFAPAPPGPVASRQSEANFGSGRLSVEWVWDTSTSPGNYNGCYQLKAEAVSADGEVLGVGTRDNIRVDTKPAKLAPPEVKLSTPQGASLEWQEPDPAVVPDVESYTLLRGESESPESKPTEFTPVRTSTKPFVFDEISASGVYWYRVVVTRRSVVTPSTGISSEPSDISEKPAVIEVPPPTPAPTAKPGSAGATPKPGGRLLPLLPRPVLKPPPVPEAPFSAVLPYATDDAELEEGPVDAAGEQGAATTPDGIADTRGWVLPVAFGAWLISTALALRRLGR